MDAIHPGYGFLSERSDFADACVKVCASKFPLFSVISAIEICPFGAKLFQDYLVYDFIKNPEVSTYSIDHLERSSMNRAVMHKEYISFARKLPIVIFLTSCGNPGFFVAGRNPVYRAAGTRYGQNGRQGEPNMHSGVFLLVT